VLCYTGHMWYDFWNSKDQVGCWNNIGSWFCFVIILTYFHLLGYVTKHIMFEHMNKLMNIPFGRLNILRKPPKMPRHLKRLLLFNGTNGSFQSFSILYIHLWTFSFINIYEKSNGVKLKMFVSFINEISSLSSFIIRNLCTYSKYLQTYYGIDLKISSIKTNGIFKTVMYETSALDCKISFEVHVKCFMWVLKKIK
jgi:hypothetical protein